MFLSRNHLAPQETGRRDKHYNSIEMTIDSHNENNLPVRSPLIERSDLVSYPPPSYMLKFSGSTNGLQARKPIPRERTTVQKGSSPRVFGNSNKSTLTKAESADTRANKDARWRYPLKPISCRMNQEHHLRSRWRHILKRCESCRFTQFPASFFD